MSDEHNHRTGAALAQREPPTLAQRAFRVVFGAQQRAFEGLPGPTPSFFLGNAGDFLGGQQPWEVLSRYAEQHGSFTVFWFAWSAQILVTDPELVGRVLEGDFDAYYKKNPVDALRPIVSEITEFVANGERWKALRGSDPVPVLLPPGVCPHAADGSAPVPPPIDLGPLQEMLEERAGALAAKAAERPCDLRPDVVRLSFDALTLMLFGALLGDDAYADYAKLTLAATRRMVSIRPSFLSTVGYFPARSRWRARIAGLVADARRDGGPPGRDILRAFLRRGTELGDAELALSLGGSVFASTQSVASGVLSTLYLLGQRPDVAARVAGELRALAPEGGARARFAEIDACETLDHAVLEALRLYPPAPLYMRNARTSGPVELGGRQIPADTTIYITAWPIHRSREHWGDNADRFEPDRWANGGKARDPLGSGWFFPFGRGRRSCSGEGLAHVTMKLMLAAILSRARPETAAGQTYEQDYLFGVLLPKTMKARLVTA